MPCAQQRERDAIEQMANRSGPVYERQVRAQLRAARRALAKL